MEQRNYPKRQLYICIYIIQLKAVDIQEAGIINTTFYNMESFDNQAQRRNTAEL